MNLLKRLSDSIRTDLPTRINSPVPYANNVGNDLTFYPSGKDSTFIQKGYNGNAIVYSIINKCAKKFAQVPWYHYKVKRGERKTYFDEYLPLTKSLKFDPKAVAEAKRMRMKAVEQVVVADELSQLLARPNRNQTGAEWREQLYGYKLLTGEGNVWLSRPTKEGQQDNTKPPTELFIIPKANLALVGGPSFNEIAAYKLLIGGREYVNAPANIISWIFPGYEFNENTLQHLRGLAPLEAGKLALQTSNEGQERLARMNANQGVAGLTYRYDAGANREPTPAQALFTRQQFNSIVNDKDLAGSIAYMTGQYGFIQYGMTVDQLKLIEQSDGNFKTLCNVFDLPWQLFGNNDAYENRKQYKRDFIYDNIGPACYSLRDELNNSLISAFGLDRDRDVIDCAVTDLPEMVDDLQTQVAALQNAWWLTPNERREQTGYDKSDDPNMEKIYLNGSLRTLDQANADIGEDLTQDVNLLNDEG